MFPKGLLIARAYKDQIRPVLLGEGTLEIATNVIELYRDSIGKRRREVEERVRKLEGTVEKYKVVRGLAILVERSSTYRRRDGPEPEELRKKIFAANPEPAVTPEERERVLSTLSQQLGLSRHAIVEQMWADLEEEEVLVQVPALDPFLLLKRFNLGQCQTLLFRANQLSLSFDSREAYLEAIRRIKLAGLMFTATLMEPVEMDRGEVSPAGNLTPLLEIEGVLSFLHSTEKYGRALARLLPDLLSLPGWRLSAKVIHTDTGGKRKVRDFHLDSSLVRYLDVRAEDLTQEPLSSLLDPLVRLSQALGLQVERRPQPTAAGGCMEFPDLFIRGNETALYVEEVGYWSLDWVKRKLLRTETAPNPCLLVAHRDLAVTRLIEHRRLIIVGKKGPDMETFWRKILTPWFSELQEKKGYLSQRASPLPRKVLFRIRKEVREALPMLEDVDKVLRKWELPSTMLPSLGFAIRWRGLDGATVVER